MNNGFNQEFNFDVSISRRDAKKLFSNRRHAFPRKLKKAISQMWRTNDNHDGTISVTFDFLRKTKHQRKACRMVRILPETQEVLIPYKNGKYVCIKQR